MDDRPQGPSVEVLSSDTLEFGVFSFLQRDKKGHRGAWVANVHGRAGDLVDRMNAFSESLAPRLAVPCDECRDVMVLIDRAEMLESMAPERFFGWLRSPLADFSDPGDLESESAEANGASHHPRNHAVSAEPTGDRPARGETAWHLRARPCSPPCLRR